MYILYIIVIVIVTVYSVYEFMNYDVARDIVLFINTLFSALSWVDLGSR